MFRAVYIFLHNISPIHITPYDFRLAASKSVPELEQSLICGRIVAVKYHESLNSYYPYEKLNDDLAALPSKSYIMDK